MKIKLFYQKHNESLDDFEYRVNLFTLSVSMIVSRTITTNLRI